MVIFKDAGQGGSHESLAEPDNVPDKHAVALVEMMRGDLDGSGLIVEELVAEITRNTKFLKAGAGFLRKVVSNLDIDMVWRN